MDVSPFDFGAMAKRYVFDVPDFDRRKKAFDRLDESPFFGAYKKRAFDRLDSGPFGFTKRSSKDQFELRFMFE